MMPTSRRGCAVLRRKWAQDGRAVWRAVDAVRVPARLAAAPVERAAFVAARPVVVAPRLAELATWFDDAPAALRAEVAVRLTLCLAARPVPPVPFAAAPPVRL